MNQPTNTTALLVARGHGETTAFDQPVPLVHDELRRLARRYMRHERPGHTLQATALVNEAYLRLVDVKRVHWQNRAHFFAMSARVMRRILLDSARARGYDKRGGGIAKLWLDEGLLVTRDGPGSPGAQRRTPCPGGGPPSEESGRGAQILRRVEPRRDGDGAVRFVGARPDVPEWLAVMDIFVFPS